MTTDSPLACPQSLPLLPPETTRSFGPTLVVAPHQDDESLGCGGTIALLRAAGVPVRVLFISDGSGSHPGSRRYPPQALTALRNAEAREALALLGVDPAESTFLALPDRTSLRRSVAVERSYASAGTHQRRSCCRGGATHTPTTARVGN
jgi:LmbE family N-acetylglucosaminyl deacetylase